MKRPCFILLLLLCASIAQAGLDERPAYQPIIDVKPFGEMGQIRKATPEQLIEEQKQKEAIAQKFRMCGVTDRPDGQRAIACTDETSRTLAYYILAEGESQNGFMLLCADYEREYATLQKDGLTFTLGLGKGLIDEPPQLDAPIESPEIDLVQVNSQKDKRHTLTTATPPKKGSYRERLLKREAAKKEKEAQAQAAATKALEAQAEKLKAQERRLQIERIKRGLAPTTPIVLTPEEDRELAEAGVFNEPNEAEAPDEAIADESSVGDADDVEL
jgi:hypothetical protein